MIEPVPMESDPSLRESQEAPLNGSQPTPLRCRAVRSCVSQFLSLVAQLWPSLYDPMY